MNITRKRIKPEIAILAIVFIALSGIESAWAQYPKISSEIRAESARRNKQMQRHSDEA